MGQSNSRVGVEELETKTYGLSSVFLEFFGPVIPYIN